jgi:hypothetical protein
VAKVLSLKADGEATIHWFDASSVDRTWSLQYKSKKGKGTAGPYTQTLNIKRSLIDTIPELHNKKKGKINTEHIEQLLQLMLI